MGTKHMAQEHIDEARRRYEAGESTTAIAKDLGYSSQGLRARLKREGVRIRGKGEVFSMPKPHRNTKQKQTMIEIPLVTAPKKVAVIICDPSTLSEVVSNLWK